MPNITLGLCMFLIVLAIKTHLAQALFCYRCDTDTDPDCAYYPAPLSAYENCDDKLKHSKERKQKVTVLADNSKHITQTQMLYIRYRYRLCPLLETTSTTLVPQYSNPLETENYVCGKVTTSIGRKTRIRRGCTPDIFLNGTNACISLHPDGYADIACFCTGDFCNHGVISQQTFLLPVLFPVLRILSEIFM